jgi:hypothetical protein
MPTDLETLKNITGAIQSIVLSIAIIIGGIWTAYTFSALRTREKAEADLKYEESERLRQTSVGLEIIIDARQEQLPSSEGHFISALVKLTNKGNRSMPLNLRNQTLQVWKVDFDTDGSSAFSGTPLEQRNLVADSIVLRPGTTVNYPFLVNVPERGFYVVSYLVKLDKDQLRIHIESGGPTGEDFYWPGNTYVLVK